MSDTFYEPNTKQNWHFNEQGDFVNESGKRREKGSAFRCENGFREWVHAYVQRKLIERGLNEHKVPNTPNGAPVFATPGFMTSAANLLVLICGSGEIFAGLWSVGVCSWKGLHGTVLPYLDEARKRNMEVIILNPNHPGSREIPGRGPGSQRHTKWVFENMIMPARPLNVYIVAHSAGGMCTCTALRSYRYFCQEHVRAIALTDACTENVGDEEFSEWCRERSVNWIQSSEPLNAPLGVGASGMCVLRSAAIEKHPDTQYMAYPHIWELFDEHKATQTIWFTDKYPW